MSQQFDRSRRLITKRDYAFVFENARKWVTPNLTILYRDNHFGHARLGLALSKRVLPKAHDRNRVKRLLREAFRTAEHLPAIDMVVLAKSDVLKTENTVLLHQLRQVWGKLWQKHGVRVL